MNQYRRIVSYLYKYVHGRKGENTGFVRIDTRPEGIRLHFRIKDLRMMDEKRLKVYFYFHKENRLQLVFVDEFPCTRGNCEYKKLVLPDFTDSDFEKLNGVVFLDQEGLVYGSCWDEREISDELLMEDNEEIVVESIADNDQTAESTDEELHSSEAVCPVQLEEESERKDNPMPPQKEDVFSGYKEIILEGSENTIQAVHIGLSDLSKLPSREWPLAENAFLKQAYESEQHLLLGRVSMPNESKVWILGVPGTYGNREKYLAGIFGFSDYIPLEKKEFKTGGKGYWIRTISSIE